MTDSSDPRLERLLGGEALAALRERLRRRFERDDAVSSIRLDDLAPVERAALASLAGLPTRSSRSLVLDVGKVDLALASAELASSLRDALERLDGPIVDRAAVREQERTAWELTISACEHPQLLEWLCKPANLGMVKRLSGSDNGVASAMLQRVAAVLNYLPCQGVPRSQVAATLLGDAHALDAGRAEATVTISVLRDMKAADDLNDVPEDVRTRDVWADAGVLVNELARPALCLNIPVAGAEAEHLVRAGEPRFFSLRRLLRTAPQWEVAGLTVYVCENPNLVAIAADQLGARCAPLVCTEGMPAAAQRVLLHQLRASGAVLAYHGDFDWPGIRIAGHVIRMHGAIPWRMGSSDYEQAVQCAPTAGKLSGHACETEWDSRLSETMAETGVAVAEEAIAQLLLPDLGGGA
ncbi:hypothetical protein BH11PSE8_BH11PSE8_25380 [soil metagenome]